MRRSVQKLVRAWQSGERKLRLSVPLKREKRRLRAVREAVDPALTGVKAPVGEVEERDPNERVIILLYNIIDHIIYPTG